MRRAPHHRAGARRRRRSGVHAARPRGRGFGAEDVGHVNAHGTSTPLNDAAEAAAINKVFGDKTPVTSTKGVTGHLIGAAGAAECVAALLACRERTVPPTANHHRTDPEITVDVVAGQPRAVEPATAVSNSFGFGGHNATLVVRLLITASPPAA